MCFPLSIVRYARCGSLSGKFVTVVTLVGVVADYFCGNVCCRIGVAGIVIKTCVGTTDLQLVQFLEPKCTCFPCRSYVLATKFWISIADMLYVCFGTVFVNCRLAVVGCCCNFIFWHPNVLIAFM